MADGRTCSQALICFWFSVSSQVLVDVWTGAAAIFWFLIRYVHSPVLPSGEWHDPENLGRIGSQGTWSFHELSIGNWKLCSKSFGVFFTQPVGKFEDEEHTSWEKMFFGYPRLLRVQSTSPPILIYRAIHPGESTIGVCGIFQPWFRNKYPQRLPKIQGLIPDLLAHTYVQDYSPR